LSFEISRVIRRVSRVFLIAAAVASLAACQVRPLYSSVDGAGPKLAAVKISQPRDRVEQQVRNHLVFLTNGGAGEPAHADYQLQLYVTSVRADVLDEQVARNTPTRVTVSATFTLTRISDGKVLKTGTRAITSLADVGLQEFAKLRAYRDAEDRASRELAEFLRGEMATVLARNG
jgi:LPS-assembly lipoprotein